MAKIHKKQHHVPETYLRAWCDHNVPKEQAPYVWLFSKEGETGKAKAPKNIFHETDFYTIKGPNSSRDLTLEKGLSQLERAFSTLQRETLDRRTKLTFRDTKVLLAFNATMYARSKFQRDHWRSGFSRASEWSGSIVTAISKMSVEERQHFLGGCQSLPSRHQILHKNLCWISMPPPKKRLNRQCNTSSQISWLLLSPNRGIST